eukprot:jgi/Chrzof1/5310/Cz15g21210.t1
MAFCCTQICASVLYRDANGVLTYNASVPTNDQPKVYLDDTPDTWDNNYYQNLLMYKGVLLSDESMFADRHGLLIHVSVSHTDCSNSMHERLRHCTAVLLEVVPHATGAACVHCQMLTCNLTTPCHALQAAAGRGSNSKPHVLGAEVAKDNDAFNAAYITAFQKMTTTGCLVQNLDVHTYATIPTPAVVDTCQQNADNTMDFNDELSLAPHTAHTTMAAYG